jgi:hypothetical protein
MQLVSTASYSPHDIDTLFSTSRLVSLRRTTTFLKHLFTEFHRFKGGIHQNVVSNFTLRCKRFLCEVSINTKYTKLVIMVIITFRKMYYNSVDYVLCYIDSDDYVRCFVDSDDNVFGLKRCYHLAAV